MLGRLLPKYVGFRRWSSLLASLLVRVRSSLVLLFCVFCLWRSLFFRWPCCILCHLQSQSLSWPSSFAMVVEWMWSSPLGSVLPVLLDGLGCWSYSSSVSMVGLSLVSSLGAFVSVSSSAPVVWSCVVVGPCDVPYGVLQWISCVLFIALSFCNGSPVCCSSRARQSSSASLRAAPVAVVVVHEFCRCPASFRRAWWFVTGVVGYMSICDSSCWSSSSRCVVVRASGVVLALSNPVSTGCCPKPSRPRTSGQLHTTS